MIVQSITELIGNTPVFKLAYKNANIYVKLEKYNAGGSIKDRAVLKMIEDAESSGELKRGDVLIEATSGNTGIALAMLGINKGYRVIIVMPDNMSIERRTLIKAYGAQLVLTDGHKGMQGSIEMMDQFMNEHPNYKSLKQFENPSNPLAHYETTAREIVRNVPNIDAFCAGVGTGGTLSGISKYLKEYNPKIYTVGLEPVGSPLLSKGVSGSHDIQGIGANFIPLNYQKEYIDNVLTVSDEAAYNEMRLIAEEYSLLLGISSGCNIVGAKRLVDCGYHNVVTIAPDGIEKYLNMNIF
ncbi:MAG: cysteine synthase family protein [Erysipelotrichales bacterium]|nr:cysteine synthase family protein [Erysipelotrichales bacterium]